MKISFTKETKFSLLGGDFFVTPKEAAIFSLPFFTKTSPVNQPIKKQNPIASAT
jgi:hypothetical protein